mgnify:CR=1 FL=1
MVAGIKSVGGVGGAWSGIGLNGEGVGVIEFTVIFAIERREGGIVVYHGHIRWRIYIKSCFSVSPVCWPNWQHLRERGSF